MGGGRKIGDILGGSTRTAGRREAQSDGRSNMSIVALLYPFCGEKEKEGEMPPRFWESPVGKCTDRGKLEGTSL